MRLIVSRQLSL